MDEPQNHSDEDRTAGMDARDWIVRLTSGDVSEADLQRFKSWRDSSVVHRKAFERERLFWQELQDIRPNSKDLAVPNTTKPVLHRRMFLTGGGLALAASVAAVSIPSLKLWWKADFKTAVGEQSQVSLPDGSTILLNTDSAVKVDFSPDLRLVTLLKGEVDFNVQPSRNALFRVDSEGGFSDALGTVFSVRLNNTLTTVTVSEGLVSVTGAPNTQKANVVFVNADEQTRYLRQGVPDPVQHIDIETELAWKTGRLIFEARSFGDVIADIGRYLPERIILGPGVKADVPVSGVFSTSEMLPAIRALTETQGLTVHRIPGVVILIS